MVDNAAGHTGSTNAYGVFYVPDGTGDEYLPRPQLRPVEETEHVVSEYAVRRNQETQPSQRQRLGCVETRNATGNITALYFNFGTQGKKNEEVMFNLADFIRRAPGIFLGGSR